VSAAAILISGAGRDTDLSSSAVLHGGLISLIGFLVCLYKPSPNIIVVPAELTS